MQLIKLFKALVPTIFSVPAASSKERQDAVVQKLVRTYARGNVNLQYGRYVTEEQLTARKQKLARHAF